MTKVVVTDHAVVRYMERVIGLDIEQIKGEMIREAGLAACAGAARVKKSGFTYAVSHQCGIPYITTVYRT